MSSGWTPPGASFLVAPSGAASRGSVRTALSTSPTLADLLSRNGRYITLAGRESAIETRRHRAAVSSAYWGRAVRYGRLIGGMPFVRMVAVTGALAMDNLADEDIDYLIVTEPGRLWLCRAVVVGVVPVWPPPGWFPPPMGRMAGGSVTPKVAVSAIASVRRR